jgi:hypothetical protein
MDDATVVGVDDSQEVRPIDTGARPQADEVEKFLGRGLHRLLRGAMERARTAMGHRDLLFDGVSQMSKSFD